MLERLNEACRQSQQGFTSARGPQNRDEIDFGIHQQIEREVLLAIARADPPNAMLVTAKIPHDLKRCRVALQLANDRLDTAVAFLVDELVRDPLADGRSRDFVESARSFFPGAHVLAVPLPKVGWQRVVSRREHIGIFDSAIAEIVLCMHANDGCFDAQINIFGDKNDARIRM